VGTHLAHRYRREKAANVCPIVNRRQSIVEPARPASVASLGTSRLAGSRFPRSRGICGDEPGESGGPGLRWKPGWGRLQAARQRETASDLYRRDANLTVDAFKNAAVFCV